MSRKRARITVQKAQETLSHMNLLSRFQKEGNPPTLEEVEIDRLMPNPYQPRKGFLEDALEELANSIQIHGFFGHLLVRPKGARFELAFGERRLRAAVMAGVQMIPVQIQELSDQAMMELALTENIQREDLHPLEEAHAFAKMRDRFNYSVREIARRVGKSKSYVSSLLSLLRYSDVEDAVREHDLPVRTAEELSRIEDEEIRKRLTLGVIEGTLDRKGVMDARAQEIPVPEDPNLSLFGDAPYDATDLHGDDQDAQEPEAAIEDEIWDDEDDLGDYHPEDMDEDTFDIHSIPHVPARRHPLIAHSQQASKSPPVLRALRRCAKLLKQEQPLTALDDEQREEAQEILLQIVEAVPTLLRKR